MGCCPEVSVEPEIRVACACGFSIRAQSYGMISNRFVAHVATLFCYPFIAFAAGLLYLLFLRHVLGVAGDGFGATAAIIAFPMYSIPLFAIWLVAWEALRAMKRGPIGLGTSMSLAVGVALLFSMVVAGPRGFSREGGAAMFNYFFIGIQLVGASVHYLLVPKSKVETEENASD